MASVITPRSLLVALLLTSSALGGCSLFRRDTAPKSLAVDLPVSRADAIRATTTAFREQGYKVRSTLTSGSQPETEPFRQWDDAEAVFRASISGNAKSSRVVLTGSYRRLHLRGVVRDDDEHELHNSNDPVESALWKRLEQLRLAIMLPK
jgi:hypothetical protein